MVNPHNVIIDNLFNILLLNLTLDVLIAFINIYLIFNCWVKIQSTGSNLLGIFIILVTIFLSFNYVF